MDFVYGHDPGHCTRLCTCCHRVSDSVSIEVFARDVTVGVVIVQFFLGWHVESSWPISP